MAQVLEFKQRSTKADWEKWLDGMRDITEQVAQNNREAARSAREHAHRLVVCEAGSVSMKVMEEIIVGAMAVGFVLWGLLAFPFVEMIGLIGG